MEAAFDAMKNELENDKSYMHTTDGIRGYFFISFISLYMYFSILQVLKDHGMSQNISVKEALFELSKIYVIVNGGRRTLAEIPSKSKKVADLFRLKLYKISGGITHKDVNVADLFRLKLYPKTLWS